MAASTRRSPSRRELRRPRGAPAPAGRLGPEDGPGRVAHGRIVRSSVGRWVRRTASSFLAIDCCPGSTTVSLVRLLASPCSPETPAPDRGQRVRSPAAGPARQRCPSPELPTSTSKPRSQTSRPGDLVQRGCAAAWLAGRRRSCGGIDTGFNESPLPTLHVGTHPDVHVAAAVDPGGWPARRRVVSHYPSRPSRPVELAQLLRPGGAGRGTGSYGAGLARHLSASGIVVVEVDRPNRQPGRRNGKSD